MTWSSARARAISASSSMADILALVTRGLEGGGPRQFRTNSGSLAILAAMQGVGGEGKDSNLRHSITCVPHRSAGALDHSATSP